MEFTRLKNWLELKKSGLKKTPFLGLIKTPEMHDQIEQIVDQLLQTKASFSEGIQILELSTELLLLEKKPAYSGNSTTEWIQNLKILRYPSSHQIQKNKEDLFLKLPWPHGSKIKFERRGDRTGVELKCFISSEVDLTKMLAALERVQTELKNNLKEINE